MAIGNIMINQWNMTNPYDPVFSRSSEKQLQEIDSTYITGFLLQAGALIFIFFNILYLSVRLTNKNNPSLGYAGHLILLSDFMPTLDSYPSQLG